MTEANEVWAAWLTEKLAGRPNSYLVRRSGTKDNGRPVIDDSRVSKWLSGQQRPSLNLAVVAARALDADEAEALQAAGYGAGVAKLHERYGGGETAMILGSRYATLKERLDRAKEELQFLEAQMIDVHRDLAGKRAEVNLLTSMVLKEAAELDRLTDYGGGDDDGTATSEPVSAADDELPAAAKGGQVEESGEFND